MSKQDKILNTISKNPGASVSFIAKRHRLEPREASRLLYNLRAQGRIASEGNTRAARWYQAA